MDDQKITLGNLLAKSDELRGQGQTVMFVAMEGKPLGLIGVSDPKTVTHKTLKSVFADCRVSEGS
jgi:Cu+-exporting ATPase